MRAAFGESGTEGAGANSGALQVLKSWPAITLEAAWFYLLGWLVCFAIATFQPNSGRWEFEEWLLTAALLLPIVMIPWYLGRSVKHRSLPQFRHWLPWVARAIYVSIILALCDCWMASTERRVTPFSKGTWAMSDGGTRGSVGFGYALTYHRQMGGEYGPEVWFWFAPFTVRCTTEHTGLRWLWQRSPES